MHVHTRTHAHALCAGARAACAHRPTSTAAVCDSLLHPLTADHDRAGGPTGMVRVWRLGKGGAAMVASMKDHKGPVNAIVVKGSTNDEAVSASSDGSCIIWDLMAGRRRASMFANTFFLAAAYHPDESQLVTTGTDRKARACAC